MQSITWSIHYRVVIDVGHNNLTQVERGHNSPIYSESNKLTNNSSWSMDDTLPFETYSQEDGQHFPLTQEEDGQCIPVTEEQEVVLGPSNSKRADRNSSK